MKIKKTLSPFYHKIIFLIENEYKAPIGILQSFSVKNIFYDKIDFRRFYFHVKKHWKSKITRNCFSTKKWNSEFKQSGLSFSVGKI